MASKKQSSKSSKRCTCGHLARSHHNGKGGCLRDAECSCKAFTPPLPRLVVGKMIPYSAGGPIPMPAPPMPLPLRVATKGPLFFRSEDFEAGDTLDARSRAERRVAEALGLISELDRAFALRLAAFIVSEVVKELRINTGTAAEWKGRK